MSRRDRMVLQLLMIIALATFLFGVWAVVVGVGKSSPAQVQLPETAATNQGSIVPAPH